MERVGERSGGREKTRTTIHHLIKHLHLFLQPATALPRHYPATTLGRSFLRRLFVEQTPAAKAFKGLAWLFLGVANKVR